MIRQKHTEQKKCFQRVRDEIGDRLKQFAVTGNKESIYSAFSWVI